MTKLTAVLTLVTLLSLSAGVRLCAAEETSLLSQATVAASTMTLAQAQAPAVRPSRDRRFFWTGLAVTAISTVGLLAVKQGCDGLRFGDTCLGDTNWPAGQIAGWSGGIGAGVLMMALSGRD